jgi:hypothetical protein
MLQLLYHLQTNTAYNVKEKLQCQSVVSKVLDNAQNPPAPMITLSNPALWLKICDRKITAHLTLFQQLKDFSFFVSLVLRYDVLFQINIISITMQSQNF